MASFLKKLTLDFFSEMVTLTFSSLITNWSGGCSGGTCTATANALKVPFADPGKFGLKLRVTTTGAQFRGVTITQPRSLSADGELQVYVTLPALVP